MATKKTVFSVFRRAPRAGALACSVLLLGTAAQALQMIPVAASETVAPAEPEAEAAAPAEDRSVPYGAVHSGGVFSGRDPFVPVPAAPKTEERQPQARAMPKGYKPDPARLTFRGVSQILKTTQVQLFDPVSGRSYFAAAGKLYDSKLKPVAGITAAVSETEVTLAKGGKTTVVKFAAKRK